jgi:low affinity Fe/Cu permease
MALPEHGSSVEQLAYHVTKWCGTTQAFLLSIVLVISWLVTGPFFGFSDTWQLVANTFTTLVNFIMAFVVQRTLNKAAAVQQMKLDELLASKTQADKRIIKSEDLSEGEVAAMEAYYRTLGARMREKAKGSVD